MTKTGEEVYTLPCHACGDTAAVFDFRNKATNYKGICHSMDLDPGLRKKILSFLEKEKVAEIHKLVKVMKKMEDGLDAYCPDCDRSYCKKHYNVNVIWDDGYYDYAEGTCPKGHKRILDD